MRSGRGSGDGDAAAAGLGRSGVDEAAIRCAAEAALAGAGVPDGHLAIAFAGAEETRRLNREHRGVDRPTDVLSFPVDGRGPADGPRELGDVVICPEHTGDVVEAVVHGVLHLCGFDHESDRGEMAAVQGRVLTALRGHRRG